MEFKHDFQKNQGQEKDSGRQEEPKLFLDFNALSALTLVTQLGLTIGITAVGGVLAGRWLDGRAGTGFFAVAGLLLGLAAGILSAYRLVKRTLRS